jgi:acetyltransferase
MVEVIPRPATASDVRDLALLLLDAIDSGASVSFMSSLTLEDAEAWWRESLAKMHERAIVLVARDDEGIVGCVELLPAWPPNQPHRADIAKLLVRRRARGRGISRQLMRGIEERARASGFSLLVLDTKKGDAAESLYRREGWIEVGVIPNYALNPDGTWCDTVVFYKEL